MSLINFIRNLFSKSTPVVEEPKNEPIVFVEKATMSAEPKKQPKPKAKPKPQVEEVAVKPKQSKNKK